MNLKTKSKRNILIIVITSLIILLSFFSMRLIHVLKVQQMGSVKYDFFLYYIHKNHTKISQYLVDYQQMYCKKDNKQYFDKARLNNNHKLSDEQVGMYLIKYYKGIYQSNDQLHVCNNVTNQDLDNNKKILAELIKQMDAVKEGNSLFLSDRYYAQAYEEYIQFFSNDSK